MQPHHDDGLIISCGTHSQVPDPTMLTASVGVARVLERAAVSFSRWGADLVTQVLPVNCMDGEMTSYKKTPQLSRRELRTTVPKMSVR